MRASFAATGAVHFARPVHDLIRIPLTDSHPTDEN